MKSTCKSETYVGNYRDGTRANTCPPGRAVVAHSRTGRPELILGAISPFIPNSTDVPTRKLTTGLDSRRPPAPSPTWAPFSQVSCVTTRHTQVPLPGSVASDHNGSSPPARPIIAGSSLQCCHKTSAKGHTIPRARVSTPRYARRLGPTKYSAHEGNANWAG